MILILMSTDFRLQFADLPWVASMHLPFGHRRLFDIRDTLFIKSAHGDLITFAKEIRPKLDLFFQHIFSRTLKALTYGIQINLGIMQKF